jgi:hypothetical protein
VAASMSPQSMFDGKVKLESGATTMVLEPEVELP